MDKLNALRTYVAIVDRGSLPAAAETIGKSLPTVVRTLSDLEGDLGVTLLRRTTRRMSLTDEGRVYLDRARRILSDVADADELVQQSRREPRGLLRVTAPVLFGHMHVAPAVVAFAQKYACVDMDMLLLDRVVNLVEEGVDVAVRIGRLSDSSLIATTVGHMRRVVVASPKLLRQTKVPKHPRRLTELPVVSFNSRPAWRFVDEGRELNVPVQGRVSFNQAAAAVQACEAGLGYGAFLAYQVAPAVRDKRLRIVLRDFEPPALPVSMVYPEARMMSTRLRTFLDWMRPLLVQATKSPR